jgi:hypothetical protein
MFRVMYRSRKCGQKSQKVAEEAQLQCFLHCKARLKLALNLLLTVDFISNSKRELPVRYKKEYASRDILCAPILQQGILMMVRGIET